MKIRQGFVHLLLGAWMLAGPAGVQAQTCAVPGRDGGTASSGTVNTYYPPANGSYNSASTSIALGASTGAATAVAPGDLVVVMQMQCANLNATNTSNYGAGNGSGRGYTDPVGSCLAGRYEYVRAGAGTTAASLDLRGSPLSATYVQDPGNAAGRRTFQVIRVPQHAALTLTGAITAPFWNGSTGGAVVLDVAGALNWNGQTIDVSGRGFRGGGAVFWNSSTFTDTDTPPDWVTTLATMPHATKGEGIAGTPRFVFNQAAGRQDLSAGWVGYPGGDHGRGAPGNAGGGGNNRSTTRDNGGGGGGGNGGVGGFGGYGWKDGGWGGVFTASDADLRGIGGAGFPALAPNRVVMGGGGGAGGSNNDGDPPLNSNGAAGGGIVIVRAGSMTGTGSVNASGAASGAQPVADAAGGGGAGGSVVLMSVNGGLGTVAVNANGGAAGDSYSGGAEAHGGGGGGGGGVVITSVGVGPSVAGGANGITNTGDNPVGGAAHGATAGASGSNTTPADSSFNTRPSAQCLPALTVTKTALTPTVTTAAATSVSYTIVVSNSGGAAIGADLVDNTLPPGWTFSQTSGLSFAPALSGSAWGGFVEGATAGQPAVAGSPGGTANLAVNGAPAAAPLWGNLTIPGQTGGTPGVVTLSFVVSVPASAPVGCFQNPAGVKYLDPTRSTAGREIAPATNNNANRAGAQVGGTANTSYETNPGSGTTVGGSQHSGLVAGPASDDVCLQGDLSITKSAPTSVTAGQTLTYTLTPRNNGRAVRDLSFASDQATDAANASPSTRVLADGVVRVTDTLPAGVTVTSAISSPGWGCTLSGLSLSCDSTLPLPIAASTDLNAITATVRVSNSACPAPLVNTAAVAGFQAPYIDSTPANGSSTVSTSLVCNGTLTVAKDNGTSTVTSGDTTTYTVTVANLGPASADGTVVSDQPDPGLSSCSVVSCSAGGGSPAAVCPATPTDLLAPGGVGLPGLPAGGTVTFGVRCSVTASGT